MTVDTVDLLEAVGISQLPLGVVNTTGICDRRANEGVADRAYRLTQRAVLTVSTAQVFQGNVTKKKLNFTSLKNVFFLLNIFFVALFFLVFT